MMMDGVEIFLIGIIICFRCNVTIILGYIVLLEGVINFFLFKSDKIMIFLRLNDRYWGL